MNIDELQKQNLKELQVIAKECSIKNISKYKKLELCQLISESQNQLKNNNSNTIDNHSTNSNTIEKKEHQNSRFNVTIEEGILEVIADGYGFLRMHNFLSGNDDIYVSPTQIKKLRLKTGDLIKGKVKEVTEGEKFRPLIYIDTINGLPTSEVFKRGNFEDLTPIYPEEKITLETTKEKTSTRIIDLIAPIGKGQRGLIVAPPKTGKTVLLKEIANAITTNHKDIHLIVLLIDERPEEVTDIQRTVQDKADGATVEIVYSTFDEVYEKHKRVAEMVLERAKRLVEHGKDLVILLDSITRLGRAYNLITPPSGKTLSGGIDPTALYMPKKFFGAARNIENGGSLTILGTALIETGSKMDDVIFEEFKGTGNMELVLDRRLSEKRIYPSINIIKSGTRREDLLLTKEEIDVVYDIKNNSTNDSLILTDSIIKKMNKTSNNKIFISSLKKNK